MKAIAVVLIAIGLVGLIWGGVTWTQREEVLDIGPVEVTREERETLPIPPIVGGICIVAGVLILVAGGRR
jgi:uncharacterized membrane protein YidH (DUF202 family)